jgi:hypothetical protein
MATTSDDSGSNALLIVLAIILAVGAAIFFFNYMGKGSSGPSVNINADLPSAPKVSTGQ